MGGEAATNLSPVWTIILCLLSSAFATAIVTSIKEIIVLKMKRKEVLEDRAEDRADNTEELTKQIKKNQEEIKKLREDFQQYVEDHSEISQGIVRSNKLLMREKIEYLCLKYIHKGEISHETRKMIHEMWHEYHFTWKGNGDLDLLMASMDELPLTDCVK